jgi:hypothetical protein
LRYTGNGKNALCRIIIVVAMAALVAALQSAAMAPVAARWPIQTSSSTLKTSKKEGGKEDAWREESEGLLSLS